MYFYCLFIHNYSWLATTIHRPLPLSLERLLLPSQWRRITVKPPNSRTLPPVGLFSITPRKLIYVTNSRQLITIMLISPLLMLLAVLAQFPQAKLLLQNRELGFLIIPLPPASESQMRKISSVALNAILELLRPRTQYSISTKSSLHLPYLVTLVLEQKPLTW